MKYVFRPIIGVIYLVYKYIMILMMIILLFIWYFKIKPIKKFWRLCKPFYVSNTFHIEVYRYNTFLDFINNKKDYSHSKF